MSCSPWIELKPVAGEVVMVKYNAGNVRSVTCALNRLGIEPVLSDDPDRIRNADRVLFPGVGEASSAMDYLRKKGLDKVLRSLSNPFLGICLGMQLMCSWSEENDTKCLGIFDEKLHLFPRDKPVFLEKKVPHMGWNTLTEGKSPLFRGITDEDYFYFVHSYYVPTGKATIASGDYITPFSAALGRGNFFGVQFHPEKSGKIGERVLKNFFAME